MDVARSVSRDAYLNAAQRIEPMLVPICARGERRQPPRASSAARV
jgi:hypothetical protein